MAERGFKAGRRLTCTGQQVIVCGWLVLTLRRNSIAWARCSPNRAGSIRRNRSDKETSSAGVDIDHMDRMHSVPARRERWRDCVLVSTVVAPLAPLDVDEAIVVVLLLL